ncbi:MAG: glycoside hydrolase family 31 protein [Pseudobacter sp.]|uniref:glycoside hydrolase family 31 protein n=1 Tax=Pseudobacter sp. TaxID=2045420 RepID=UPI003F81DF64
MRNVFLCLLLLVAAGATYSQDQVINPGDVQRFKATGNQLELFTSNANIRVQVYNASMIRVRMTRGSFPDDFSYAVIARPGEQVIKLEQTGGELRFQTDSVQVRIQQKPFSIAFYTLSGQVINQDEPGLATSWVGTEVTSYKKMQPGERFIGLGEKTGPLDRKGNGYTNWNSDVFGYAANADPLYSTIPFYIGVHSGVQYGIFFDNSWQSDFNFGASNNRFSSFGARGGEMNYYFIYSSNVAGIINHYTALTGRMSMPPLWSLGYQQNRYSYYPDTEVLRIAQTLREKKIPADGITLDIHYMDAYKLFTWNRDRFPDPKGMIDSLNRMGFKTTLIVDPGIKVEKGYAAYESGLRENIFLKYSDGQPYTGEVWPGWCHFPDFTSVKGRNWWKKQITGYTDAGVNGIWNDMNEIATWGQKMPNNVLFDYDGHPTTHLKGHNVFGLQMARCSYEGTKMALQKRPFILTRAGYAGLQRYAALWTGDNRAEDDHMLAGVRLLSSLGLSGVPFSAMDVGGFTGNATVGLYTRWMQLGAFIPYFRNHTQLNTKSAEPWTFGEDVTDIARNYINLRYRLLPYLYSTFHEATENGMPIVRSLAIDYTHDPHIYQPVFQNQFFFGSSLLVMPQESVQQYAKVYLPAGEWYSLYTDAKEAGAQEKLIELNTPTLPVYVKGGSIIPMQSLIQHTGEKPSDTLTLHVYNGADANTFVYYEDDGFSYNYESGEYYQRSIRFDPASASITLDQPSGKMHSKFRFVQLMLHGFDNSQLTLNGSAIQTRKDWFSYLDAYAKEGSFYSVPVTTILLPYNNNKTVISFK